MWGLNWAKPNAPRHSESLLFSGTTDSEATINTQGWLANPDRNTLTFFATHAYPLVQRQIIANHRNIVQHIRAITDESGALHWVAQASVFDTPGLRGREHKLTASDIHLTTAKVGGIQTILDRSNDLLWVAGSCQHIGIGHAQAFRLVAQDLAGMWTVEALADELSGLADRVIDATLRHTWRDIPNRHIESPRFAVIGYGKLGGKELSYASDLDVIFLYDDPYQEASEVYSRLARKMVTWLTSTTAAGVLYDIDLRLRPNGSSGLMVSSVQAFENYQHNQAWVWEHQALTRARYIAGDKEVGARFDAARHAILSRERDPEALAREVCDMRARMLETHPAEPGDVKHARGGLVDIEFMVQYLILAHGHDKPSFLANTGTIALLALAAKEGLIPPELADQARNAYRYYRRLQHAARLNEAHRTEVTPELEAHYQHAQALWKVIFPDHPVDFT